MLFPHRESTFVRLGLGLGLGPVEAYAAFHRRTMTVVNSAVVLSLHSVNRSRTPDALRS
jgi:hypothetical protein